MTTEKKSIFVLILEVIVKSSIFGSRDPLLEIH